MNPSPYAPTTATDHIYKISSDLLMPDYTSIAIEDFAQRTSTVSKSQYQLLPTPIPTSANGSGDDGIIITLLPENSTSTFSPTISPSPTTNVYEVTQSVPVPDIVIKLRLNFSADPTDQQRMQVEQSLSLFVQDILQLSIPPNVSQEPGNIFNVLIVSSSSNNTGIASGSIDAITALLAGVHINRPLGVVDVSQALRQSRY